MTTDEPVDEFIGTNVEGFNDTADRMAEAASEQVNQMASAMSNAINKMSPEEAKALLESTKPADAPICDAIDSSGALSEAGKLIAEEFAGAAGEYAICSCDPTGTLASGMTIFKIGKVAYLVVSVVVV